MLMELRENVSKLDATAYAELKSYKEPPPVVHQILKAVLAMFYVDKAKEGEFDDWDRCKKVCFQTFGNLGSCKECKLTRTYPHKP